MTIPKRAAGAAKYGTLLAMSWSLGIAIESRLEAAHAPLATVAQAQAPAAGASSQTSPGSWWQPVAQALR
jgi:hypothetical protein